MQVAAQQSETIDEICWRFLGRTGGVTEQAYEMNRGLATLGAVLPEGTVVTLPDPKEAAPETRKIVNLWD